MAIRWDWWIVILFSFSNNVLFVFRFASMLIFLPLLFPTMTTGDEHFIGSPASFEDAYQTLNHLMKESTTHDVADCALTNLKSRLALESLATQYSNESPSFRASLLSQWMEISKKDCESQLYSRSSYGFFLMNAGWLSAAAIVSAVLIAAILLAMFQLGRRQPKPKEPPVWLSERFPPSESESFQMIPLN